MKGEEEVTEIDNKVGFIIHKLDMGIKRVLDAKMTEAGYDEVTLMHGWILKYLYENRHREVYQKDIEKQFGIGRSTVTTIIQLMEKRDFIRRESVEHDARLKKVILTEKGYVHHNQVEENICSLHNKLLAGISQEEKEAFLAIAEKMGENLRECRQNTDMNAAAVSQNIKEE